MRITTNQVAGFGPAMMGMRAPLKSYDKSDSTENSIGPNDYELAMKLCKAGPEHRKWMRQIWVWATIEAPLLFFKEFDTYKIATTANSESTMHTLMSRKLTLDDFEEIQCNAYSEEKFKGYINFLNDLISSYKLLDEPEDYAIREQIFLIIHQCLPQGFKQKRWVNLNYETIRNMYHQRKDHKLPYWRETFCDWVKSLPYSEFLTN